MSAGNKSIRRRVMISSDEDSDDDREESKQSGILSEDGSDVVDESIVAASDESGEVIDDSVVADSEEEEEEEKSSPSTPSSRAAESPHGAFVASTPLNKKDTAAEALNKTFDRMSVGGDRSSASRSLSNSSIDNNDRERSFHGKEAEDSPISKRLNAQSDLKSKQALRERLLRKQAMAARDSNASYESGERSSSSLINTTLSPIGLKPIPRYKDEDSRGSASDMDIRSPMHASARSPMDKSGSGDSEVFDDSMSREGEESANSSKNGQSGESSRLGTSSDSNKENGGSAEKKIVRKKLLLDEMVVKKETEEDKVRKFMTPRKTAKIEDSDEEQDLRSEAYPNIESEDEDVKKEDPSIVEILDSDEEQEKKIKKEEVHIFNSDDEEEDDIFAAAPNLKREEEEEEEVFDDDMMPLSPGPPARGRPGTAAMPSLSASSMTSATGLHATTQKTYTDADINTMEKDLGRLMTLLDRPGMNLPDGGAQLRRKIEQLTTDIENARLAQPARRVAPPEAKGRLQLIDPPNQHPDDYNKIIIDDGQKRKNLIGGVMTDARMANVKRITNDTLNNMHKEVTSQPDGEETATPRGLRIELMPHQKTGLTWMLWREKQKAPGGILADDMGLGKTLSLISLIMHTKNERLEQEKEDEEAYEEREKKYTKRCNEANLVPSRSTLVIAPASVIFQWEAEIKKRVKGNRLSVLVYHGAKNKREDRPKKMAKYDVVITTYNMITSELTEKVDYTRDNEDDESESDDDDAKFGKKAAVAADGKSKSRVSKSQISVLTKLHWERIILDEAHAIKNRNSLISKAVCRLPGRNKWCLTGTPVHNDLFDLFSLVRFLKVNPFDELTLWKENIMNSTLGNQRLNTLIKSLLLRRMKNQVDVNTNQPLVALAPKNYEIHELSLEGLEKSIYELMFKAVRDKVASFVSAQQESSDMRDFGISMRRKTKKKDKNAEEEEPQEPIKNPFIDGKREIDNENKFKAMTNILVLLLRLRQVVVHPLLTKEALDLNAFEGLPMGTNDEMLDAELSQLSLDETEEAGGGGEKKATEEDVEKVFKKKFESTKIRILLDKLDHAVQSGDKCVVVSQWTSVLAIIEYHIGKRDIEYTQITGDVDTKDRQERVDSFNEVGSGAQVMLLSLQAGGVGLNLVGGNHLFLVDLHWNPALEAQACDRIYRMGQTKNVFIHKLVSKGTIEDSILLLQNRKSALAKSVLEGAANKDLNKLTMADLAFLFDLNGEQKKKELEAAAKAAIQQYPSGAAAAAAARQQRQAAGPSSTSSTHSASASSYNAAVYGSARKGTKDEPITL